nr:MAG TPA: hypothetical protein [Caudoviricetes sp.]
MHTVPSGRLQNTPPYLPAIMACRRLPMGCRSPRRHNRSKRQL